MKAICNWGVTGDVFLDFENHPVFVPTTGDFEMQCNLDLSIAEAESLAQQLLDAAQEARRRAAEYDEYSKEHCPEEYYKAHPDERAA